jgi:Fe2+ transport system protein FeoA
MKLSEVPIGMHVRIDYIEENILTHKLLTLGFLKNIGLTIIRKSPFGKCYYVRIEDDYVALRAAELESIYVNPA